MEGLVMNVTFVEVGGVRMATMPAEDFEKLAALAEDRADALAAEAAEARRVAGEEYLPSEMADRIIAAESALRVWRRQRRLNLTRLGYFAGIRASYLSDLELGKKPGTPRVWRALAKALKVDVDDIMPE
jgi:hypothetical protein